MKNIEVNKRKLAGEMVRYFKGTGDKLTAGVPVVSMAVGLAAVIIHFWPGIAGLLEYERAAIASGQIWRLLTCHMVHWSGNHLLWDALVFVVLGAACERYGRGRFAVCLLTSSILIPATVWVFLPGMSIYRGLSGMDAALFIMLAFLMAADRFRDGKRAGVSILAFAAALFMAKIAYELVSGQAIFVQTAGEFVPVPLAHLSGAAAAGIAAAMWKMGSLSGRSPRS